MAKGTRKRTEGKSSPSTASDSPNPSGRSSPISPGIIAIFKDLNALAKDAEGLGGTRTEVVALDVARRALWLAENAANGADAPGRNSMDRLLAALNCLSRLDYRNVDEVEPARFKVIEAILAVIDAMNGKSEDELGSYLREAARVAGRIYEPDWAARVSEAAHEVFCATSGPSIDPPLLPQAAYSCAQAVVASVSGPKESGKWSAINALIGCWGLGVPEPDKRVSGKAHPLKTWLKNFDRRKRKSGGGSDSTPTD